MAVLPSRLRGVAAAATALLVLLAGALVALAPAATAAPYPPTNPPTLSASAYDPCAGASNIIGGTGYQPGETVLLDLAVNGEIGRTTVRADGTFELTVTIPLSARGSDRLTAVGLTSGTSVTIQFQIPCVLGQGSSAITRSGGLAYTGVAVGAVLLLAAVLLGAGAAFAVAGRRRRGESVPS